MTSTYERSDRECSADGAHGRIPGHDVERPLGIVRHLEERFAADQLHLPMRRGELDAHLAIGVQDDGAAVLQDEFFGRLVELRAVDLARARRGVRP
jgi:hypothetical protein